MGFGLCEFETLKLWPCTLPYLNSKFVAIYNMRGAVHLAYTSQDKLRKDIEFKEQLEKKQKDDLTKKNLSNDNDSDEDGNEGNKISNPEDTETEFQDQKLLNQELSNIVTNQDMRICEGDIITI